MRALTFILSFSLVCLAATAPAVAQEGHPLKGSWIGTWGPSQNHSNDNPVRVKVKALVTERVGRGVAFMPFHFAGHWMGEDLRSKYPSGSDPYVLGESSNTVATYGYDVVTQMQETKVTLCQIERA